MKIFLLFLFFFLPVAGGLVSCSSQVKAKHPISYRFENGRTAMIKNGFAYAPKRAPASVKRAIAAGNRLQGMPYKWGGGHARLDDSGYDCSGKYGKKGAGKWITVYVREGHVFMTIAGLRLDTGGSGARSGPRWKTETRQGRGHVMRHPAGF